MVQKRGKKRREGPEVVSGGKGEIVIYRPAEGGGRLEVRLEEETLWLSLNQIGAVFERDKSVISRHLRNVFRDGELDRESTVAFFATVQEEGARRSPRRPANITPKIGPRKPHLEGFFVPQSFIFPSPASGAKIIFYQPF